MNLLTLVRVGCRITVISWLIVRRSITIKDALITHHQFPTARVRRWKLRADHDLCAGRGSAAQQCRNHSQNQNQPLHLSSSQPAIPEQIRSISVLLKPEIRFYHLVGLWLCIELCGVGSMSAIFWIGPSLVIAGGLWFARTGLITTEAPNQTSDCKRGGGIPSVGASTSSHKPYLSRCLWLS